jgi:phospholipid/cholesterol/gamma-HCH transport system substrate-binding protein
LNRALVRDFLTGATALAGLAGLIAMLILFGEMAGVAERNYDFRLRLSNAGGLDDTSPVLLNGVKIGQVTKAMALQPPAAGAEVSIRVRRGINIPRQSKVALAQGFVGGASLEFLTTQLTEQQLRDVINENETLDGGAPSTLMGSIQSVVEGPLTKLTDTAAKIDVLADEYTKVGQRLNELLEPRTPADIANGKSPNFSSTLARLDGAIANADAWLTDETLKAQVRDLVARANRVMDQANELAQEMSSATKTITEQGTRAGDAIAQVGSDAQATLAQVRDAAKELTTSITAINEGKGTLGQLVNNPDLYRSLTAAADRLDRALVAAQEMFEKYKAEGLRLKF